MHLEYAPNYNGNPKDGLFVATLPDYVDYNLGLYEGNYMVVFRPDEC